MRPDIQRLGRCQHLKAGREERVGRGGKSENISGSRRSLDKCMRLRLARACYLKDLNSAASGAVTGAK